MDFAQSLLDKAKDAIKGDSDRESGDNAPGTYGAGHQQAPSASYGEYQQQQQPSGYGGHGGRLQSGDYVQSGPGQDSARDYHAGEGYQGRPGAYGENEGFGGRDGMGYSGHGGRGLLGRDESDMGGGGGVGGDSMRDVRPQGHRNQPGQASIYDTYNHGEATSYYDPSHARNYAVQHTHSGEPEQNTSYFDTALSFLRGKEPVLEQEDLDERQYVDSHQALYSSGGESVYGGGAQHASSSTIGAAAAMQALKALTSGGAGGVGAASSPGGGGGVPKDLNGFIGLAMAECVKLFDRQSSQGKLDPGANKQDAVTKAATMAMKLFLKSKATSGGGGGGGGGALGMISNLGGMASGMSGGHGGSTGGGSASMLLNMASQFLKK